MFEHPCYLARFVRYAPHALAAHVERWRKERRSPSTTAAAPSCLPSVAKQRLRDALVCRSAAPLPSLAKLRSPRPPPPTLGLTAGFITNSSSEAEDGCTGRRSSSSDVSDRSTFVVAMESPFEERLVLVRAMPRV